MAPKFLAYFFLNSDQTEVAALRRTAPRKRSECDPLTLSIRILNKEGFDSVCPRERSDGANLGRFLSGGTFGVALLGLVLFANLYLEWPVWVQILTILASVITFPIFT